MPDDTSDSDRSAQPLTTTAADLTAEIDETETPSETVVRAIASVTDTEILELEPLYDAIDPDTLDALFGRSGPTGDRSLTFTYAGCTVTVSPAAVHVVEDDDASASGFDIPG